jgi:adenylate cyclase
MQTLLRRWLRIGVSLIPLLLALAHALGIVQFESLKRLDDWLYDLRLQSSMPNTLDDRIVIVDLDEKSLAEVGRWPWPRDQLAKLIDTLFDYYGIALLGLDVVLAEPDRSSGLHYLQQLAQQDFAAMPEFAARLRSLETTLDFDARFAHSIKNRPVVLGYYFNQDADRHTSGQLPAPVLRGADWPHSPAAIPNWSGYGANLADFVAAAPVAGFFNPLIDNDGVIRSLPMLSEYQGNYYESLSLAMFRELTGSPRIEPGFVQLGSDASPSNQALNQIHLVHDGARLSIPVNHRSAALIPYRGAGGVVGGSFRYLSAQDVLNQRSPIANLQNKIVLLGTTAPGLMDLRVTPVGNVYPGVEVHANMLSGLLDNRVLVRPEYATAFDVVMLLLAGLALALLLPRLSAMRAVLWSLLVLGSLLAVNGWLFYGHGLVLPLASQLLMVLVLFALNMSYGYFIESRSKRELAQLFGTYVPPELVDEMLKQPEQYSMQASNRELTVLFCDMRGFTQMSENMEPQQLQTLLNAVFSRITTIIRRHHGTIDKYMGDCVMAFWGAPVALPQHASMAVRAGIDIARIIETINQEHRVAGLPAIGIGIGINTGVVCVGDMGSNIRRSYTVIGDAVNIASRLESLSKLYGAAIVVSEHTRAQATGFQWMELDRVRLKGKAAAIDIFTPLLTPASTTQENEYRQWAAFLDFYRGQQWHQAWDLIQDLTRQQPDHGLYRLYYERLVHQRSMPYDPTWVGVTQLETK